MNSFLEKVAADLLKRFDNDLSRVAVVFPNKRASLFLNEHLARLAGKPLWSPAYITISDLFRSHSELKVADPILLVCELHKVFIEATGMDETVDHFYGWGQLLLADFDDLDKNMGPADQVFKNLRDIHELDDISYLTDEQREIIRRFFSNFAVSARSIISSTNGSPVSSSVMREPSTVRWWRIQISTSVTTPMPSWALTICKRLRRPSSSG